MYNNYLFIILYIYNVINMCIVIVYSSTSKFKLKADSQYDATPTQAQRKNRNNFYSYVRCRRFWGCPPQRFRLCRIVNLPLGLASLCSCGANCGLCLYTYIVHCLSLILLPDLI